MKRGAPLILMLDEGAPALVADPFEKAGHKVIRHAEVLSPGAKDTLVCSTAILNAAALVATDRDMRQMAKRFGNPSEGGRFKELNLIFVGCSSALAPKRLAQSLTLIEHEWRFCCEKAARSLWIEVGQHFIRTCR